MKVGRSEGVAKGGGELRRVIIGAKVWNRLALGRKRGLGWNRERRGRKWRVKGGREGV